MKMSSFFSDDYMEILRARGIEEREKFRKTKGRYPSDKEAESIARYLIDEVKLAIAMNKVGKK